MNTITNTSLRQTLLTGLLTAGFAITSLTGNAQTFIGKEKLTETPESFRSAIGMGANSTILIGLEKQTRQAVTIRFVNRFGETLHQEDVLDMAYHRRFNVRQLPSGAYSIIISTRNDRLIQPFRLVWKKTQQLITAIDPYLDEQQLAQL